MKKLKVLVSAYRCQPDKDSEPCAAVRKNRPVPFFCYNQLISYLKTTDKRLGLILNFGRSKLEIKRVFHNF